MIDCEDRHDSPEDEDNNDTLHAEMDGEPAEEHRLPEVIVRSVEDYRHVLDKLEEAGKAPRSLGEEFQFLHDQEDRLCKHVFKAYGGDKPIQPRFLVMDETEGDRPFWFIGDVHGDLTALKTAISYIDAESLDENGEMHERPVIVFLGDIIDRGRYSREVFDFILHLIVDCPQYEIVFIQGNHDEGLGIKQDGSYYSSVIPAEFVNDLNGTDGHEKLDDRLGHAVIRFVRNNPSAIVFKYGNEAVLCTHGGVPHSDIQELWNESPLGFEDLYEDPVLEGRMAKDFTWTRLHSSARLKRPNRSSLGCQLGIGNVNDFCDLFEEKTGLHLTMILRGHDHEETGYAHYERYLEHTVVTVNTMDATESFPDRLPCVAHWRKGGDLTLTILTPPSLFTGEDE